MNYLYYCPKCKEFTKKDYYDNPDKRIRCGTCGGSRFLAMSYDDFLNKKKSMTPGEWNDYKVTVRAKMEDYASRYQQILEDQEEERQRKAEEASERLARAESIIVTTVDLHEEYDIIGPVYFQVNNAGSQFLSLQTEYQKKIAEWEETGQRTADKASALETVGAVVNMLAALSGTAQDRDLMGNSHQNFDLAFFIAVEELKKRAALLGADAIIGMRQDLDLDTTGFQHFYLQMYGTAVKFR